MNDPKNNIELLRKTVLDHYYSPAFSPSEHEYQSVRLWRGITQTTLYEPSLGFHIAKVCGKPFDVANQNVVFQLLKSSDLNKENLEKIIEAGFLVDENVMSAYFMKMDPADKDAPDAKILKSLFSDEQLFSFAKPCLYGLFSSSSSQSIRIADNILVQLSLPEDVVRSAFYAKREDIQSVYSKRGYMMPLSSTFAVFNGSMNDSFWSFILTYYGSSHEFMVACLIDLVIAGANNNTNGIDKRKIGMLNWESEIPQLSHESETLTRLSLGAMVELGVRFEPNSFNSVTYVISELNKVPVRFVEYMFHVENMLLNSDEYKTEYPQWIFAFEECVLTDDRWKSIFPPEDSETSNNLGHRRSASFVQLYNSTITQVRKLDLLERKWRDMRRFYQCTKELSKSLRGIFCFLFSQNIGRIFRNSK